MMSYNISKKLHHQIVEFISVNNGAKFHLICINSKKCYGGGWTESPPPPPGLRVLKKDWVNHS